MTTNAYPNVSTPGAASAMNENVISLFDTRTPTGLVKAMAQNSATAGASGAINALPMMAPLEQAPTLAHFQPGPIGYLQWLAVAYPKVFHILRSKHPDLFKRAQALAKAHPNAALAGLGATSSWSSWLNDALNYTTKVVNLYGTVKGIQNGTTNQVQQQVQQQVQNAAANQRPAALNTASNTPAPSPASVVHASPSWLMPVGVGGVAVALFLALRRKRRSA